jgi:hypothetical protein
LPGIDAAVIDADGKELTDEQDLLVLRRPWPGMLRTLYKDDDRFIDTYFSRFGKETYLVGDAARKDADDYFWIVGRVDDVINVSGPPPVDGRGRVRPSSRTARWPRRPSSPWPTRTPGRRSSPT